MSSPSVVTPLLPMTSSEVHVWFCATEEASDPGLLGRYLGMLNEEEREQQARFYFEKDRHLYLVAHALMRYALSRVCAKDPRSWSFEKGIHGKPEVICDAGMDRLRCNLSHTHGMVMFGVTIDQELGVDVERIRPERATDDLAEYSFADSEVAALRRQPPVERKVGFFDYWTLKESYIKARGAGLTMPLDKFAFSLSGRAIGFSVDPALEDVAGNWHFTLLRPSAAHKAAVAFGAGGKAPLLHLWKTLPLVREEPMDRTVIVAQSVPSNAERRTA